MDATRSFLLLLTALLDAGFSQIGLDEAAAVVSFLRERRRVSGEKPKSGQASRNMKSDKTTKKATQKSQQKNKLKLKEICRRCQEVDHMASACTSDTIRCGDVV